MKNSLNIQSVNGVNAIAQGDNASTFVLELQDENRLILPYLNGQTAFIYLLDKEGNVVEKYETVIFDSRVEFNIPTRIPHGKYPIEIVVEYDNFTYVFPSSESFSIYVHRSTVKGSA